MYIIFVGGECFVMHEGVPADAFSHSNHSALSCYLEFKPKNLNLCSIRVEIYLSLQFRQKLETGYFYFQNIF